MLSVANKDDFNLDDFDLDDFDLEMPDFDLEPPKDDRTPVHKFFSGALKGIKEPTATKAALERLMRSALPPGYAQAINFKDAAVDTAKDLYGTAVEELRPVSHVIGRSSERLLKSQAFRKKAPAWLVKRLENMAATGEDFDYNPAQARAQAQQNEIAQVLGDLFKQQTEIDLERAKEGEARDEIRVSIDQKLQRTNIDYARITAKGISRLVGYQDQVLSRFQQKQLELQYRHFFVARDLLDITSRSSEKIQASLDSIIKNTALPEAVKIQRSEMAGMLLKERLINAGLDKVSTYSRNYLRNITSNLRNNLRGLVQGVSGIGDVVSMSSGMGGDPASQAGAQAGAMLSGWLGEQLGNWINPRIEGNETLRKGNALLRGGLTGLTRRADRFARSETSGFGWRSTITQWLKDMMPRFNLNDSAGSMSLQEFDRPAVFDNMTRRSIVELIPSHLAEIERWTKAAVTGQVEPARVFNFNRGGFTTRKSLHQDIRRTLLPRGENITIQREFDSLVDKLDSAGALTPQAREALKRQMLRDVATGKDMQLGDYVDRQRYTSVEDEEVIEELRNFFSSKFEVGLDGTSGNRSLQSRELFADAKVAYENIGGLIPATNDRVRALVNIYGRDELARMGVIQRIGREDRINTDKLFDMILSEQRTEGDAQTYLTQEERENRYKGLSLQERIKKEREDRLSAQRRHSVVSEGDEAPVDTDFAGTLLTENRWRKASGVGGNIRVTASLDDAVLEPYLGNESPTLIELRAIRQQVLACCVREPVKNVSDTLLRIEQLVATGGFGREQSGDIPPLKRGERAIEGVGRAAADIRQRLNALRAAQFAKDTAGRAMGGARRLIGRGVSGYGRYLRGVGSLYGSLGRMGWDAGRAGVSAVGRGVRGLYDLATSDRTARKAQEGVAFLRNKLEPVITQAMLEGRELFDVASGKTVRTLADVTGEVRDRTGKVVISAEEFARGVYDRHGKPLFDKMRQVNARDVSQRGLDFLNRAKGHAGSLSGFVKNTLGTMGGLAALPLRASGWAMRKAGGIVRGIGRFFSGKASSGVTVSLTGDPASDVVQLGSAQLKLLDMIYAALNPKRKKGDVDGDGVVENSVMDILRRRKRKREETASEQGEGGQGKTGYLSKMMAGLGALLGFGKKDKGEDKDGDSGDTTIIAGGGGKLLKRVGGWAKKLGVKGLAGAWGATQFLARRVIWQGAMWAGGALVAALGAPVLIGAAIAGGAALAAYGVYKYATSVDMTPLAKMRYAQYGFDASKEKVGKAIFWLENYLQRTVSFNGDKAELRLAQQQVADILVHFGHNLQRPDQEKIAGFANWFNARFKPVYLTNIRVMQEMAVKGKLTDIDQNIPLTIAEEYVNAVRCDEVDYNREDTPFTFANVTEDAGDVEDAINYAIRQIRKRRAKEADPTQEKRHASWTENLSKAGIIGLATASTSVAADVVWRNRSLYSTPTKQRVSLIQAGLTTRGLLGATGLAVERIAGERPMVINREGMQLGLDEAARFTIYGLKSMETDKVDALRALEAWHFNKVNYGQGNVADIEVGQDEVIGLFASKFGVTLDSQARADWYTWYRYRYLPSFLNFCTGVRMRANVNAAEAAKRLKPMVLRAVLIETSDAKTQYKGADISVWAIETSPWAGYTLGMDTKALDPFLDALKEMSREKLYNTDFLKKAGVDPSKLKDGPRTVDTKDNLPSPLAGYATGAITSRSRVLDQLKGVYAGGQRGDISGSSMMLGAGGTTGALGRSVKHPGGGTGGDINQLKVPAGAGWANARDTIMGAAQIVGFDPVIAATVAAKESGFNPNAKARTSTAAGYFQFLDGTWKEMMEKYASQYGINPSANQYDPRANAILGVRYLKDNYEYLKGKIGREVTDTDLYLAHFLGPAGAVRFLSAPGNDLASRHVDARVPAANSSIFFKAGRPVSVNEVIQRFDRDLIKDRKSHDAAENPYKPNNALNPAQAANDAISSEVPVIDAPVTDAGVDHNLPVGIAPIMANQPAAGAAPMPDTTRAQPGSTASVFATQGFGLSRPMAPVGPVLPAEADGADASGAAFDEAARTAPEVRKAQTAEVQAQAQVAQQNERSARTVNILQQSLEQQTNAVNVLNRIYERLGQLTQQPVDDRSTVKPLPQPPAPSAPATPMARGVVNVRHGS
ncbi:transglycosylase SLT domain-containing protein [Pseudomonas aeruginosa]|uniref:transglycosylase SLT domain-containing protein n=1 Tax=Pseudomonas aeruginosa TaxID=287 RepID=UPI003D2CDA0A